MIKKFIQAMERIEIYTSKKKSFLMLIGSLAFVAICILMFLHADEMRRNPLFIRVISVAGVLFSGLAIFVSIKRLISNQLALVIAHEGLGVNFKKSQNNYIGWDEIIGFNEIKIRQVRIIIIMVKDPQKWLEKEKRFFRKKLMQANMTNYGSPFNISTVGLNITHEGLMEKLSVYQNTINGVSANS